MLKNYIFKIKENYLIIYLYIKYCFIFILGGFQSVSTNLICIYILLEFTQTLMAAISMTSLLLCITNMNFITNSLYSGLHRQAYENLIGFIFLNICSPVYLIDLCCTLTAMLIVHIFSSLSSLGI